MTEGQRDTDEARLQLQAQLEMEKLMLRLREAPAAFTCDFCGQIVHQKAYACHLCGWKVAV